MLSLAIHRSQPVNQPAGVHVAIANQAVLLSADRQAAVMRKSLLTFGSQFVVNIQQK